MPNDPIGATGEAMTASLTTSEADRRFKMQALLVAASKANADGRDHLTLTAMRGYLDLCTDAELARLERIIALISACGEAGR